MDAHEAMGQPPRHASRAKAHDRRRQQKQQMSDESEQSTDVQDVTHLGGNSWLVATDDGAYTAKLEHGRAEVTDLSKPDETVEIGSDLHLSIVRYLTEHGPEQLSVEESQQRVINNQLRVLMNMAQSGGGGAATASGGSGGGDDGSDGGGDDDATEFQEGSFEGSDGLKESIESWLEDYPAVESDLDPDAIDVLPGTHEGREGFKLDATPFPSDGPSGKKLGYHNGNGWMDEDGFTDHKDTFKSLMQNKDAIEWVEDGDYNTNFLPTENVEDVTG